MIKALRIIGIILFFVGAFCFVKSAWILTGDMAGRWFGEGVIDWFVALILIGVSFGEV